MSIFDFDDSDFVFPLTDDTAIDSDGNFMMKMSENMALDMDSGDIHFISSWDDEEDDD